MMEKEVISFFVFGFFVSRHLAVRAGRAAEVASERQKRLARGAVAGEDSERSGSVQRILERAIGRLPEYLIPDILQKQQSSYDKLVQKAGNPLEMDAKKVIALKTLGFLLGLCAAIVVGLLLRFDLALILALLLALAGAGLYLPDIWLKRVAANRLGKIVLELPTAIDLLGITVSAGAGFDNAVSRVARHLRGPLAGELKITQFEIETGIARQQALVNMSERLEIPEVKVFVTAVNQALKQGTPLANIIEIQSLEMRMRKRLAIQKAATTAPLKMLFPLVFFIMPSLMIVVVVPPLMRFFG